MRSSAAATHVLPVRDSKNRVNSRVFQNRYSGLQLRVPRPQIRVGSHEGLPDSASLPIGTAPRRSRRFLEWITLESQRSCGKHAPSIIMVGVMHLAIGYALRHWPRAQGGRGAQGSRSRPRSSRRSRSRRRTRRRPRRPSSPRRHRPSSRRLKSTSRCRRCQMPPHDHYGDDGDAAARRRRRSRQPRRAAARWCASEYKAATASNPRSRAQALRSGTDRPRDRPRRTSRPTAAVTEVRRSCRSTTAHLRPRGHPRAVAVALQPRARRLHRRVRDRLQPQGLTVRPDVRTRV